MITVPGSLEETDVKGRVIPGMQRLVTQVMRWEVYGDRMALGFWLKVGGLPSHLSPKCKGTLANFPCQ